MKRVVLAALLLDACSGSKPEDDPGLRNAFALVLRDPSSVQLQHVAENSNVICGEYNSKNGYGAYSGFQTFIFERATQKLNMEDVARASHGNDWLRYNKLLAYCPNEFDIISMVTAHDKAEAEALENSLKP